MNKKRNNKGFSLVELIVVIAVMAVLVVVLAPAYLRYVDKAKVQKDVSAISEVIQATKLAAAEESVAKDIGTSSSKTTIVITGSTGKVVVTPGTGENQTGKLQTELNNTLGGDVLNISSSAVKAGTVTISVYQDSNYNLTFEVATSGITNTDADDSIKALAH